MVKGETTGHGSEYLVELCGKEVMTMFRKMRRFKQQLAEDECIEILKNSTSGVLGLLGDDDYPYTVPVSHVYKDGKLYFHGAKTGHKNDAAASHEKVSYCVIEKDDVVQERVTTYYRSVICFGRIRIIEDQDEKMKAALMIGERFAPDNKEGYMNEIDKLFKVMTVFEITIEHMTGKEAIELLRAREGINL